MKIAFLLKCIEGPAAYCGVPTFSGLIGALGWCSSFWALEKKRRYMIWRNEKKKNLEIRRMKSHLSRVSSHVFFFSMYTVIVCRGTSLASPSLRDWQTLKGMQGVAAATSSSSPSSPSVASPSSSYCHHQQFTNGISSSISDVLGPRRYLVFPLKSLSFFL